MARNREPRRIIAAPIEERYARGWHCLGLAADYTEKPTLLKNFGTELVAYRGEGGQVSILDAYCPHMGGNLSQGEVCGNSLVCPFHHWSWGADGVCDGIPYAKKIPPEAVIRSWPTMEENQLLFVWHDHEGNPPIPEQRIEHIADCFSDEWTDWQLGHQVIHTNCRELVDNMADFAHFGPVHGAPCNGFSNFSEGYKYTQVMKGSSERLSEGAELTSTATYYGPAYMNTYMTGKINGMDVASRLLVTHVPIDVDSFDLRFGVIVRKIPGVSDADNLAMAEQYVELNNISFGQDVDIWHTKRRVDNPVLCDGDGPINMVRKWYSQFYMDAAQVPKSLQSKKEFVLDLG